MKGILEITALVENSWRAVQGGMFLWVFFNMSLPLFPSLSTKKKNNFFWLFIFFPSAKPVWKAMLVPRGPFYHKENPTRKPQSPNCGNVSPPLLPDLERNVVFYWSVPWRQTRLCSLPPLSQTPGLWRGGSAEGGKNWAVLYSDVIIIGS